MKVEREMENLIFIFSAHNNVGYIYLINLFNYSRIFNFFFQVTRDLTRFKAKYSHYFGPFRRKFRHSIRYTFPLESLSLRAIEKKLREIFSEQRTVFKLIVKIGVILKDIVTNELRWYWPGELTLLSKPKLIKSVTDLSVLVNDLHGFDFVDRIVNFRPNSRYKFVTVTNLEIDIYPLKMPLKGVLRLSDFHSSLLCDNRLHCFVKNAHGKPLLKDNLSLFRCLAVGLNKASPRSCSRVAKCLIKQYKENKFCLKDS